MEFNYDDLAGGYENVAVHAGISGPTQRGRGNPLGLDVGALLDTSDSNSTYLFRISGHTWADQGVYDGDIAVIDRALTPNNSDLVISWQDSGFSICRRHQLLHEEPLGVVTAIIRRFAR
jgi:hypothetical protein